MKTKLVKSSLCLILTFALCFGDFLPILRRAGFASAAAAAAAEGTQTASAAQAAPEQSEGVVRPEDIDEGLSLNSLDDIRGRRVTVRQPVMEILQDDIARKPAEVMSNVYEMLDFTSGEKMHPLAQIDFGADTQLQPGNKDHPMYPMKGLDRSAKDADGNVKEQRFFSVFKKYMLLRQAYYFNTHVNEIIQKNELKKHPAADFIYGKIPDDAPAVRMRLVTDPIYRSPMTTGLYLVPGEAATVKIKGLKKGESVTLYTHHQDTMGYLGYNEDGRGFGKMEDYLAYWDKKIVDEATRAQNAGTMPDFDKFNYGIHGQWLWQNQKVPCMGTTFTIVGTGEDKEMEVKIGSMYGGPLYVKPTTDAVEMEISGAVLTPHFVLGVTTVEEFEEQLRNAPGLIATMDVENGQLIGPAEDMKNADDIEKLAYFWHSVFAIDISLNGREYNYNMTMCYDLHVPAGEAVALNSNFCAQPTYWFPICMNYETLTTKGNWGTFHELGHVQAKTHGVNWGFCDGDGEVWNNTLILLIYSMLCNMDNRVIGVEHGEYVHPYTAIERSQHITQEYKDKATGEMHKIEDYGMINEGNGAHFDQLSMYATLLHSFGPDKFVDMFYTYKMDPAYCPNKRADFVYRIGIVDRVNILDWVNKNYFARITDDMFTEAQLDFLRNLPDFVPVAYRWANGIDGHETARKHDVDGKHPTVFDVSESEFSSPGAVEIVTVTDAQHGHAEYDPQTKKVTYTPPEEVTEYDRFDIIVKTSSGRRVTLNVNLSLVYKGLYGEAWILDSAGRINVQQAKDKIGDRKADYTVSSPSSGIRFNNKNGDYNPVEYLHMQLKFRAPAAGDYSFYAQADDYAEISFHKTDLKGKEHGTIKITSDTTDYKRFGHVDVTLAKNEVVFIDCNLVNWGGLGHMTVGVHMPGAKENEIVALPNDCILSADVSESDLAAVDAFKGWQPRFVDSIKNATIDYQDTNEGWEVLEAPVSEGGTAAQEQYRKNMVDGDESTIYHSKYNGGVVTPPHVFVIDTTADQTFNYFDIIRRTNGNDKLLSYALYSCTGEEYDNQKAVHGGTEDVTGWTKLFEGDSTNVNAAKQRISFARTQIRYFKLIITANSGHTVIREVYAGIESKLSQTVKPSNYMTDKEELKKDTQEGFVENPANGKLSTQRTGATYTFKFLGSGFELYADTAEGYGTASVTVDKQVQDDIIDLKDKPLFNKMVFTSGDLAMGEHEVVVTTLDDKPFNISFINVKYGTPVAAEEYPADKDKDGNDDYGDITVNRQFIREWKTYVKDYKTLESIRFVHEKPNGYNDTYVRIDTYIRLYRSEDGKKIAFVYPGTILAPIECASLFAGCEALTELDLTNFDTTYMRGAMSMFYGCSSLTSIDVSKFKTENVLSFGKMFGDCTSLTDMDLSKFELDENANLYRMFENCGELDTIELPASLESKRTLRGVKADDAISFELPYVYQDLETDEFLTEVVLNASMAGHKLKLHKSHTFLDADCHEQQDPTCEGTGVIAYKTCFTCHCNFDYTEGRTLYRDGDLTIPALGHAFEYDYTSAGPKDYPTCTRAGQSGVYKCARCDKPSGEAEAMAALGHSYMLDETKGDGKGYSIEYFKREEIEKTEMVDEDGNVYFAQEELVVKGIAKVTWYLICQSYSEWPSFEDPSDMGVKCLHTTEVVMEYESDTHTEATCDDDETFFFDFAIDEATFLKAMVEQDEEDKTEDDIAGYTPIRINKVFEGEEILDGEEALGHQFEKVEAIAATCEGSGSTEGQKCTVCGLVENVTSTKPLGHKMEMQPKVEPTCTEAGHEAGLVCTRCGHEEDERLHIEPLGHDFTVDIEGEVPTCTQVGHTAGKKCSRCDAIEGHDVIDDLGHEEEVIPGKAPTETESGLTDGLRCPRCGEIIQEQETIPPLGVEAPAPEDPPAPKTGLWIAIGAGVAVIAAAAIVTGVFISKKKRRT